MRVFTVLSCLLFLSLAACAPKEFSTVNEGELSLNSLGGNGNQNGGEGGLPVEGDLDGDGVPDSDGSGGGGTGTPTLPQVYPSVQMRIPTCTENMMCQVRVVMNRTDAKSVSFDWLTNDTKYQSDPGRYAHPNVHYVPTGGTVHFVPGNTEQPMVIQTLTGFTRIEIPFLYGNCKYNGQPIDCSALKITLVAI